MSEYAKQAEKFLTDNNATMEIEFDCAIYNPWNDHKMHNAYNVTIERNGEEMTLYFKGSAYAFENDIEPTAYDILACVQKYEVRTYPEFCYEFGYDNTNETMDVYEAVKSEYEDIKRLFGDCMDELREID